MSQIQQTFYEVAGFDIGALRTFINTVIVCVICLWGSWVLGGYAQRLKKDVDVFELLFCFVEVFSLIGIVMWIVF